MKKGSPYEYTIRRSPFPEFLAAYRPFLPTQLYDRLYLPLENEWLAVEAALNSEIVGLALAECYFTPQTAQLFALHVREPLRNQGIGQSLLSTLEKTLHEKKIKALGFEYEKSDPAAPALERILKNLGWSPPSYYFIRLTFDTAAFNPPWIQRSVSFPKGFTLFPWQKRTLSDKQRIHYLMEQGHFPPYLSPLREEAAIHMPSSFGLRHEGKIIGWSITHLLNEETLRYTTLYIHSNYKQLGLGMRLGLLSIQANKAALVPKALLEFNLKGIDPTWRQFVKRKILPIAGKVERLKWAFKAL
ncbi:MAG: GNAT family N-acetyltransferase [Parachlamydia sp.]|jgi:GNAT superfamily N-acetyltransferase|nr:GNAT family N-acetyltransferase [Parachlamydia sp.]